MYWLFGSQLSWRNTYLILILKALTFFFKVVSQLGTGCTWEYCRWMKTEIHDVYLNLSAMTVKSVEVEESMVEKRSFGIVTSEMVPHPFCSSLLQFYTFLPFFALSLPRFTPLCLCRYLPLLCTFLASSLFFSTFSRPPLCPRPPRSLKLFESGKKCLSENRNSLSFDRAYLWRAL